MKYTYIFRISSFVIYLESICHCSTEFSYRVPGSDYSTYWKRGTHTGLVVTVAKRILFARFRLWVKKAWWFKNKKNKGIPLSRPCFTFLHLIFPFPIILYSKTMSSLDRISPFNDSDLGNTRIPFICLAVQSHIRLRAFESFVEHYSRLRELSFNRYRKGTVVTYSVNRLIRIVLQAFFVFDINSCKRVREPALPKKVAPSVRLQAWSN